MGFVDTYSLTVWVSYSLTVYMGYSLTVLVIHSHPPSFALEEDVLGGGGVS